MTGGEMAVVIYFFIGFILLLLSRLMYGKPIPILSHILILLFWPFLLIGALLNLEI
jgi:hypothetical protein